MEHLMSNGKLHSIEVRECKDQSYQIVAAMECEFERFEVAHYLEEEEPIYGNNWVETEFEIEVRLLQFPSLCFSGIGFIQSEQLIQKGQQNIGDNNHNPCVIPHGEIGKAGEESHEVIGEWSHEPAALAEEI